MMARNSNGQFMELSMKCTQSSTLCIKLKNKKKIGCTVAEWNVNKSAQQTEKSSSRPSIIWAQIN